MSWTGLSSWERGKSGGEVKRNCWEKIALPCLPSASDQISWNPRLGFKATLFRLLSSAIWNKLSQMTTNKAGGTRLTSSAEQNFEDLWDILASFTNCRNLSFSCTLSVFLIFRSVLLRGKWKWKEISRCGQEVFRLARHHLSWNPSWNVSKNSTQITVYCHSSFSMLLHHHYKSKCLGKSIEAIF